MSKFGTRLAQRFLRHLARSDILHSTHEHRAFRNPVREALQVFDDAASSHDPEVKVCFGPGQRAADRALILRYILRVNNIGQALEGDLRTSVELADPIELLGHKVLVSLEVPSEASRLT